MSEGEVREVKMDKSAGRQSSVPPRPNGSDSKKDASSRGRRKGGPRRESRPKNEGTQQRRPPQQQQQLCRPTDKRPRVRGYYNDGQKQEMSLEESDVGSVFRPGAKKQSYNHLLNFSFGNDDAQRRGGRGGRGGRRENYDKSSRRQQGGGGLRYNKEQFLQANCQFVVVEGEDFSVHSVDADTLVDWSRIEQVRLYGDSVQSCPICLFAPVAAKITRCGHIYCWPCILHYLSLSEKTWAKCPICYESVHEKDLRSVVSVTAPAVAAKDKTTLTLMKRVRDSTYAAPVAQWSSSYKQPYNLQQEDVDTCFAKLLSARPDQIQKLFLDVERGELVAQLQKEDFGSLEASFVEAALMALSTREKDVALKKKCRAEVETCLKNLTLEDAVTDPTVAVKRVEAVKPNNKPVITYRDAFDDEEDKQAVNEEEKEEEKQVAKKEETDGNNEIQSGEKLKLAGDMVEEARIQEDCSTSASDQNSSGMSTPKFSVGSAEEDPHSQDDEARLLDEAAAIIDIPQQQQRQPNQKTDVYYFYQAATGQQIYLHSLNARCLIREYGSLEHCPPSISGKVKTVEACTMTEELRTRHRYINHLPLTCEFQVVELDLQPPLISKETLGIFKEEIQRRHRDLRKREQAENRKLKQQQENENRKAEKCPKLRAALGGIQSQSFPEIRSVIVPSSAPSLMRTSFTLSESPPETPPIFGSPPPDDQSSVCSWSQMVQAGKAKQQDFPSLGMSKSASTPVWPATSNTTSRNKKAADSDSDNEDRVPEYNRSFQMDIQAALDQMKSSKAEVNTEEAAGGGGGGKKKKKKLKQFPLFSTSMNRNS